MKSGRGAEDAASVDVETGGIYEYKAARSWLEWNHGRVLERYSTNYSFRCEAGGETAPKRNDVSGTPSNPNTKNHHLDRKGRPPVNCRLA